MEEQLKYMDYLWVQADDDVVTVGITEEGLEGFDDIETLLLPDENSKITEDEVCGNLETDQGPFSLFSPIDGTVIEINEAVVENPKMIFEDPTGDGWLFRVEAENITQVNELAAKLEAEEEDDE